MHSSELRTRNDFLGIVWTSFRCHTPNHPWQDLVWCDSDTETHISNPWIAPVTYEMHISNEFDCLHMSRPIERSVCVAYARYDGNEIRSFLRQPISHFEWWRFLHVLLGIFMIRKWQMAEEWSALKPTRKLYLWLLLLLVELSQLSPYWWQRWWPSKTTNCDYGFNTWENYYVLVFALLMT